MWNRIFSFLRVPPVTPLLLIIFASLLSEIATCPTVPFFQNLHFWHHIFLFFVFFSLNTIPLLVFVSLIPSPNPLSPLLARVYPLWLQPPRPALFDCICFFFILSSLSLFFSLLLSLSLYVCVIPLSSSSVCLSPSVLLLHPHSTLLFPFHLLALL